MKLSRTASQIILISLTVCTGVGVVIILTLATTPHANQKNGFGRKLLTFSMPLINTIASNEINSVIGYSNNTFFFQTKDLQKLLTATEDFETTNYHFINVPTSKQVASRFNYTIDASNIYLAAGNARSIFISNKKLAEPQKYTPTTTVFTRSIPISNYSFAFRGFSNAIQTLDQIFFKVNLLTNETILENKVSERIGDAGLATDGILDYDSTTNYLTFINFYRGKFIVLDTNLNKIYSGSTIDTIESLQTKSGNTNSNNHKGFTNIVPARIVNRESCVANGFIFNQSLIKADNESNDAFSRNAVIDIYKIKTGEYQGSFYIPYINNQPPKRFKIFNHFLLVTYKNKVALYNVASLPVHIEHID